MATPEMGIYQFNEEEGKGAAERPRRTTRKQLLENGFSFLFFELTKYHCLIEHPKRVTRHLSHNQKGHLLTPNGKSVDLCDCLKRECPGCNFPVSHKLICMLNIQIYSAENAALENAAMLVAWAAVPSLKASKYWVEMSSKILICVSIPFLLFICNISLVSVIIIKC